MAESRRVRRVADFRMAVSRAGPVADFPVPI